VYTGGSVINGRILKWVFITSSCHLFSVSNCSISRSTSCHVTQITAVCSCCSNEIISFHLHRPGHESKTDTRITRIYISYLKHTKQYMTVTESSTDPPTPDRHTVSRVGQPTVHATRPTNYTPAMASCIKPHLSLSHYAMLCNTSDFFQPQISPTFG